MKNSVNIWKVLFFCLLGWQFYAGCAQQQAENKPLAAAPIVKAVVGCPVNSIPDSKGATNTGLYKSQHITMTGGNLVNPTVNQFILPKCELSQMLTYTGGRDSVIAQLAINPGLNGAKDTVDLYFLVYDNSNSVKYYDFIDPCPPCITENLNFPAPKPKNK